jgi:hypothetical protein
MAFHRIHFLANETPSSKSLNHFIAYPKKNDYGHKNGTYMQPVHKHELAHCRQRNCSNFKPSAFIGGHF